ncbi:class IIb bacteriocin, lactobin A/cerein 7B family [Clostridium sporogenes]|uniref:Class IIb bacteriocin, lactobin A/cerein 7B family n=1 Tax=Clostridium botulinum TaxID=1491 RepID=A0A6M0SWP9_CLOBO|nr:class IIb bacteriocin, lactobin A/cerein 7B family [Clostridium sporogenes]NFA58952.1 class IIb bacteriocin, lactobin A/cerein 7B family [Clostridium botulinum]NFI73535.1 class IIb bacteriocin, lactobin A/cerein 7B family [Clostridium sporogenes]NFL71586.1 class IIb bacteriocin, lactobin A/cerein 7B family [Clostridium sporogenes]NFM25788.1 class IIb bacteriocin, lactobin A/cerein 7B family [Clostridium sporogenes]NFP61217.1 class IIb bacteriocin, lactobin A/cerein 7B family [Clostridium sp
MKNLNEKELLNINGGIGPIPKWLIESVGWEAAKYIWNNRDHISDGVNSKPGWRLPGGN